MADLGKEKVLGLPVAGLMSNEDGYKVAESYTTIDKMVKEELGSTLAAPFMTLLRHPPMPRSAPASGMRSKSAVKARKSPSR